jgi:alpha-beta hydrolase superfamily lysophospholipase
MKRASNLFWNLAAASLLCLFSSFFARAYANPTNESVTSRSAEVDGVKLHYLTAGKGPALILIHGYAETSRMWRPIIPLLAERFTVIAPDLPGIGDSVIPANGLDM